MRGFLLLVISSLFLCLPCFAQEPICFSNDTAKKMIVVIEKEQILEEQVELYQQSTEELEKQVRLLKEINELQKQQIQQTKEMLQIQKEGYESIIKESKPNIFKQVIQGIGFVGIGIMVGLLL